MRSRGRRVGCNTLAFLRLSLLLPLAITFPLTSIAAVVANNVVVVVALALHGRGCSMDDAGSLLLKSGHHLPM
jgi:hypothetical protein